MPFALRLARNNSWYRDDEYASWLHDGELQADALAQFATESNILSVYVLSDDLSNLKRVVAALAARREGASELDVFWFPHSALGNLGLEEVKVPGQTPDKAANDYHRDVAKFSATKLNDLARYARTVVTSETGGRARRFAPKEVAQLVDDALNAGHIKKINDRLRDSINRHLKRQA